MSDKSPRSTPQRRAADIEQRIQATAKRTSDAVDENIGLQMISIRLQKGLVEDLKFIATAHGIGYQPLIKDILHRFVVHEKKQIISDAIERKRLELDQEEQALRALELKQRAA